MRKYFVTGLVLLLPLAVTVAVLNFIITLLTKPFKAFVENLIARLGVSPDTFGVHASSTLLILITLFVFTVCLGMVTRWFFFKTLIHWGDSLLHKIPVINKVYKTVQEIIKTIFVSDDSSFKQVVMVPFPKENVYVLGLISREAPIACSKAVDDDLITVLIPTTPNPTSGFLVMYRRVDIVNVDMTPEQAIKYIVSCGVIVPAYPTT